MTEQFSNKDKAWSARFAEPVAELLAEFDVVLVPEVAEEGLVDVVEDPADVANAARFQI